jgi:hypothetical protein
MAAGTSLGAVLLVLDASERFGGPGSIAMWLGLASLGSTVAFALDDAAATITSVAPVRQSRRVVVRLLVPATLFGLWAAYAAAVSRDQAGLSLAALLLTGGGVLLLSAGLAAWARITGLTEPGTVIGPAVLLLVMVGVALPFMPGHVHLFVDRDVPGRVLAAWILLSLVQVGALTRAGSDPWRRRRHA